MPREVHPLVRAVNDLMARLDEVLGLTNRFVADAAHELRTPVAGMKAHVELALREEDPQEMRRSLAQLYVGIERMSHLVAQLLSLARNEPTAVKQLELAPVDLARLAFDVTTEWVPQAYRRHIDLGFDGAREGVMVAGDAQRLAELLNNLVDNAIRYSRDGGGVTVRVAAAPQPRVSVSDDGPTIPVPERERVFERFHRLLGTRAAGSGLGLAIVREIATLHGATIVLDDDIDGVGNTFTVSFPGRGRHRPGVARLAAHVLHARRQHALQLVEREGLVEDRGARRNMILLGHRQARHQHHRKLAEAIADDAQQVEAVDLRHADVRQHEGDFRMIVEVAERFGGRVGTVNGAAAGFQHVRGDVHHVAFVVGHQYRVGRSRIACHWIVVALRLCRGGRLWNTRGVIPQGPARAAAKFARQRIILWGLAASMYSCPSSTLEALLRARPLSIARLPYAVTRGGMSCDGDRCRARRGRTPVLDVQGEAP